MIHLNYNNLDDETQCYLHSLSKKDVEMRFGGQLWEYALKHGADYEKLLEEETIRNLYNYKYVFNIWYTKHSKQAHRLWWAFFMPEIL